MTNDAQLWPHEAPWHIQPQDAPGGADLPALFDAARRLLDGVAGASLPAESIREMTARIDALATELAEHAVEERLRWDGQRPDMPARGLLQLPPFVVTERGGDVIRGHVTFTRVHLGGNGAAHGGMPPALFDDVLGWAVNQQLDGVARTAFLKVNYRSIAPLGVRLDFDGTLDRVDGRKRWASGRISDPTGRLIADAEGLFLVLRPGQS